VDHRRTASSPIALARKNGRLSKDVAAAELFGTEDELVQSLRSQLLVQTTLVEHLEGELTASQSLVGSLSERYHKAREAAAHYKEEEAKHKQNLSKLKRKCHELEGMIEEANGERSQRSLLDECTADAMRVLQERCLEAEEKCKREVQNRKTIEGELHHLQECLDSFNSTQQSLYIPEVADGEEAESLKGRIKQLQLAEEQRKVLEDELEMLRIENEQLQERVDRLTDGSPRVQRESTAVLHSVEVTDLREIVRQSSEELDELKEKYNEEIANRDEEIEKLRAEVSAQWTNTETGQQKVGKLMVALEEKANLLEEMEHQNEQMELGCQELLTRCQELEEECQVLGKQKQEMLEDNAKMVEIKQLLESERSAVSFYYVLMSGCC
jgi:chromosome segregation ATPase